MGVATCLPWVAARVGGGEELGALPGKLLPLLQDWTLGLESTDTRGWVAWPILTGWWCLALGLPFTFNWYFRLTSFIFSLFPFPISLNPLVPEGDC